MSNEKLDDSHRIRFQGQAYLGEHLKRSLSTSDISDVVRKPLANLPATVDEEDEGQWSSSPFWSKIISLIRCRRWISQAFQSRCQQNCSEDGQWNGATNARTWVIRSKHIGWSRWRRMINDYRRTECIIGDREKNILADSSNQSVRFDSLVGVLMDRNIIRNCKSTVRWRFVSVT